MGKREILFRGKRTGNGEWVEGLPGYDINGQITEIEVFNGFACCYAFDVDPETIGQDTGLTDKNGRKIFDGDICEIHSSYIDEEDGLFIVEWDEHCAKIILSGEGLEADFDAFNGSDCKVVGNKYDNPELIDSGGYAE